MPAAKRFSIDVNGNKQTTQTYNINAGEGVRGEVLRFRLPAGNKVELTDETTHAGPKSIKAQRVGENLHIAFQTTDIKNPDVIIEGFYAKGKAGDLIGKGSNGKYYEYSVVSDDKLPADNAVLTSSLSSKATTAWGDPGAAVETVVSGDRAGLVVAAGSSESARTAAPAPASSAGKGVSSPAPAPEVAPVASKAPAPMADSDGGGFSMGTVGWVLGGVALVGLAAAGGGGGGGDSTPAPAPSAPSPSPTPDLPTLTLTGPATVAEAAGTATYTATLSAASSTAVTVHYSVAAGTATAGADFNAVSGTLTFAAGTTTQTFTVPVADDKIVEAAQTFVVSLDSPTNATLNAAAGALPSVTTSITDNDTQTVATNTPTADTVAEGASAVFTITLSEKAEVAVQHSFVIGGTATAGADRGDPVFSDGVTYNAASGKITVPAGVSSFTVTVGSTAGDGFEFAESIVVTVDTKAATVTIPLNFAQGTDTAATDDSAAADASALAAADMIKAMVVDDEPKALVMTDGDAASKVVYAETPAAPAAETGATATELTALSYSAGVGIDDLLLHAASASGVTGA